MTSLEAIGAKGLRKIENYIKRQSDIDNWFVLQFAISQRFTNLGVKMLIRNTLNCIIVRLK